MDKLTIFGSGATEVTLKSADNNTLDTVVEGLSGIKRELKLTRKGNEAFLYDEEVENSDEVDLEDTELEQ